MIEVVEEEAKEDWDGSTESVWEERRKRVKYRGNCRLCIEKVLQDNWEKKETEIEEPKHGQCLTDQSESEGEQHR